MKLVPWKRQPPAARTYNAGNPITRGLAFLYSGATPGHDLVTGTAWTRTTGTNSVLTPAGLGTNFSTIAAPAIRAGAGNPTAAAFVAVVIRTGGGNSFYNLAGFSSTNTSFQLADDGGGTKIGIVKGGVITLTAVSLPANEPVVIVASHDSVSGDYYIETRGLNSNTRATATQTQTSAPSASNGNICIHRNGGGNAFIGTAQMVAGFRRHLSRAEHASLIDNPWQLFEPRHIFLPTYVAGGAFTLPLDAGSYAQTGQEASIAVSRNLSFDNGAYTFNGQPTTVVVNRNLTFDAGSYTVSGQNAGAVVSRQLSFDAGSYSYLGQDVTLTYDSFSDTYTLALEAGSYTYTGQSTGLSAARKLGFDAGSYSYSGQPISVTVNRQISFDAGSYNVTGQTTTFKVSRNLVADSGAYTYTGQTTGLTYSGASFVTIKAGSWLRYRVI